MSTLTDDEKAKLVADGVDGETQDETTQTDGAEESEESTSAPDEGQEIEAGSDDESERSEEETDDGQTEESEESEENQSFTKKFANIKGESYEEYTPNLEEAYSNSTTEAIRLAKENRELKAKLEEKKPESTREVDISTHPAIQYYERKQSQEVSEAFKEFRDDNPDIPLDDVTNYDKFAAVVEKVGDAIRVAENREPSFREMFDKAANVLGWTDDGKDKVALAVKDSAASQKTNSGKRTLPKSKVTDGQVKAARNFYPGKSDSEIRAELEQYVS